MANPDCDKCGLFDRYNGPVPDDGGDYLILAVGEAPGEQEDKEGKPFVGRSGRLLRNALGELGYPPVTYTNIVRCRPPNNKLSQRHIRCCYTSLPIRDNTQLVLLLGNVPMKAVLGETGITAWNGVVVERDGVIYAPVYHPAYILRNDSAMDDWLDALDNALNAWVSGAGSPADVGYEYFNGVYTGREVYDMCAELMASPVVAFDMETAQLGAFDVDNRVLAVSFATANKAWAVPMDHPDDLAPISDRSLDMICNVLENHPHIIGHNIKFDQMHSMAQLDCRFDAHGDSMLASFLVKSKKGIHGLKRLAGYYLNMFEYDAELGKYKLEHPDADPKRGGSYAKIPLSILLPYAAKDAAATFQLEPLLVDKLSDKQLVLYRELMVPASNTLARMQCNGMAVDPVVAERYRRIYTRALDDIIDNIDSDPMVRRYVDARNSESKKAFTFNPGSWQQKAVVLYGTRACTKKGSRLFGKVLLEKWQHYARKYYGLKPNASTKSGAPSTSRGAIKTHRDECPLVADLIMHGLLGKMLGTYINPVATKSKLSGDGRARSSFGQHTVETGRLSSSGFSKTLGFNQQNIPVPEKEPGTILAYQPIKNMFTHTWDGGCLLSADYAGMELRVFASLAGCEPMLEIHRSGRDFHRMVGSMVSGIPPDQITVEQRYRYKWTNWTLLYGGSAYTLNRLYGIDLGEAEEIIRKYYATFPEVPEYKQTCVDFTGVHGYIETPFGNRRSLPDINASERGRRNRAEREAVNMPVQGAAGLVTVMALVIIDNIMQERGYKSMLVNTVHDSIVADIYPGELELMAELCVDVMEDIIEYGKIHMPNIDMSWLICPLAADVEIGSHYGCLEHYDVK